MLVCHCFSALHHLTTHVMSSFTTQHNRRCFGHQVFNANLGSPNCPAMNENNINHINQVSTNTSEGHNVSSPNVSNNMISITSFISNSDTSNREVEHDSYSSNSSFSSPWLSRRQRRQR
jgi:hypothetical protein